MEKLDSIYKFVEHAKLTGELNFLIDFIKPPIFTREEIDYVEIDYNSIKPFFTNELKNITSAIFAGDDYSSGEWGKSVNPDDHIFNLKNLRHLDLSFFKKELSDRFNEFQYLETIKLGDNDLIGIPSTIKYHGNLKEVGLIQNPFIEYFISFQVGGDKRADSEVIKDKVGKLKKYFNSVIDRFQKIDNNISWGVYLEYESYQIYVYVDASLDFENISLIVNDRYGYESKDSYKIFTEFKEHIAKALYSDLPNYKFDDEKIHVIPENKFHGSGYYTSYNLKELKNWIAENKILTHGDYEFPISSIIQQIGGTELISDLLKEIEEEKRNKVKDFHPISSFHLLNFKLFKDLDVSDLSPSINLVIGKNGLGKTSVLQAISMLFSQGFSNQRFISKDLDPKLSYLERNAVLTFNSTQKKILNGDREEPNFHLKNNFIVLAYGVNLFSKENHDHKTFAEKLIGGNENPVNVFSLFQDFTDLFYNPLRVLDEILYHTQTSKDKTEVQHQELNEIIELLISTWNEFLRLPENENYQVEFNGFRHSFKNSRGTWLLDELSEGFRSNMLLVSDIFMRIIASRRLLLPEGKTDIKDIFAETTGLILIDEFDRHLHPSWQRVFLQTLKRVLPKVQFFASTHNILATQSAEGEKAIVLSNSDNEIVSNTLTIKKGWDFELIFEEVFEGKKQVLGLETQNKLDQFYDILNQIYDTHNLDLINTDFKALANELSSEEYNLSIQNIINSEIKQLKSNFRIPKQKLVGL